MKDIYVVNDVPIGNIGLDAPQHINASLIESHENSVVELSQPQKSENSDDFGA